MINTILVHLKKDINNNSVVYFCVPVNFSNEKEKYAREYKVVCKPWNGGD